VSLESVEARVLEAEQRQPRQQQHTGERCSRQRHAQDEKTDQPNFAPATNTGKKPSHGENVSAASKPRMTALSLSCAEVRASCALPLRCAVARRDHRDRAHAGGRDRVHDRARAVLARAEVVVVVVRTADEIVRTERNEDAPAM